jgi:hypothetical protein
MKNRRGGKMKRLDRLHWALLSVIVLLVAMISAGILSPYRYEHTQGHLIRIHRLTGEPERLTLEGWQRMGQPRYMFEDEARANP